MILSNKGPGNPSKPSPGETANTTNPPPPAYDSIETSGLTQSIPPVHAQNVAMNPATYRRSESAATRFLKAFCVAVLVWFLLAVFTESIVDIASGSRRRHWHGDWSDETGKTAPDTSYGSPEDCISGDLWTFESYLPGAPNNLKGPSPAIMSYRSLARTSYTLPVDSEKLFLVSRGALASGSVHIDADGAPGSNVTVDITASYYSREALDRATVCLLQREGGQNGVGIFTPRSWPYPTGKDMVGFDVSIHFPTSSNSSSPLLIKHFETDLPASFSHTVDSDISSLVAFRSLRFKTSNAPISVSGIYAEHAEISTSNTPIIGSFNTSESLRLTTSNARIDVRVQMHNVKGSFPTETILRTSNNVIDADFALFSDEDSGAAYTITSTTSNGRLNVKVHEQPLGSRLRLDAESSNSPASVTLPPAYEGSFYLKSSNIYPRVEVTRVEDPSGEGRQRDVNVGRISGGVTKGYARWASGGESNGQVDVRTSNSPAVLWL